MAEANLGAEAIDAFILYNEREQLVPEIAEALRAAGRSIHFWRTDIGIGEEWLPRERERLEQARAVLIFLGSAGWGPTQETIAIEAVSLNKRIIPVLIGESVPESELDKATGLFRHRRYLKIYSETWRTDFPDILKEIPIIPEQHSIIQILRDGDDDARRRAIDEVANSARTPPDGLIAALLEELDMGLADGPDGPGVTYNVVSARSWMLAALVGLADEQSLIGKVASRHLDPQREPAPAVRFWLLVNLANRFPAMAMVLANDATRDPSPNVRLLAELIGTVNSDAVHNRLLAELQSPDPEPALRYYRVRPVPGLLGFVARLLGRQGVEHLVLDALTENVPPELAANAVLQHVPPAEAAIWIVRAAASADRVRRRRYAELLAALPREDTDQALSGLEDLNPETKPVLQDMRRLMDQPPHAPSFGPSIAGYQADTVDDAPDHLDIQRDVDALTAIMLAKDLSPPLAIGLFGEWGAGKSFFMRAMKAATRTLRARFRDRFCEEVVEIDFNAWHYADGNLWASLVSHILERLSAHVSPHPTPGAQEEMLGMELESARAEALGLEKEMVGAVAAIQKQEEALHTAQVARETAEIKLTQLRAADLRAIFDDPTVRTSADEALKELGLPTAVTQIQDLQTAVRQANSLGGRIIALLLSLSRGWKPIATLVILTVIAILPLLIIHATTWAQSHLANVIAWIAALLTLLSGGAHMIRAGLKMVSSSLKKLEDAKARIDKRVALRRETPTPEENELQEQLAHLKGTEDGLAAKLKVAAERVVSLEERITLLKERKSLRWFLADRSGSEDYRKHLGVMATIRRDFEDLVRRLQEAPASGHKRVDRIILYIDDLDRCPAPKVVDVLEAVHLLLAFPLFVVVVGVDPRWLAHALSVHHGALSDTAPQSGRPATPQDFLEKIFQIPLALRPISDRGLGELMTSLLRPEPSAEPLAGNADFDLGTVAAATTAPAQADAGAQAEAGDPEYSPKVVREKPAVEALDIEALEITAAESRYAASLLGVFTTPRAVKRFTNTYRLLKAQIDDVDRHRLEGDVDREGEYPIAMTLLAPVISHRLEARAAIEIFERVTQGGEAGTPAWRRDLDAATSGSLQRTVMRALELYPDRGAESVSYWLPRVARYTFEGLR